MAVHHNRPLTLDRKSTNGARGARLQPVGQRLVNFLRGATDHDRPPDAPLPPRWIEQADQWPVGEKVLPRFPVARQGYDCTAVDGYVAELEEELAEVDRELAELRAQSGSREEVADEIKRVGQQTSAVLIAANEQREEILRGAREEANRRMEEAMARASALTTEGEVRLRDLQAEREAVEREHDRLLGEVRNLSAALAALAGPAPESVGAVTQQEPMQPGAEGWLPED